VEVGGGTPAPSPPAAAPTGSLVGADMSLSAPALTLAPAWGAQASRVPIALLYLLPLLGAALHFAWMRSSGRRRQGREFARARRALEAELASGAPAREAAPRVLRALRTLAASVGREGAIDSTLVERLETTSFDPSAGSSPMDAETIRAMREIVRELRAGRDRSGVAGELAIALGAALWLVSPAPAEAQSEASASALEQARATYGTALAESDRVRRTRLFAEAERGFRIVAAQRLHAPELLVDWGNAALGAGDRGRAVLAWRRALAVDPGNERAARNLAWVRDRAPIWLPRPAARGALDSLLFWRGRLSVAQRHWVGAGAFALAVGLAIPWSRRRAKALRRLAVVPFVVWVTATGSSVLSADGSAAGVLLADGATLRSADSVGAPPAFGNPLPSGTEVTVLEERAAWVRAALADGTQGWLPSSGVARVGT